MHKLQVSFLGIVLCYTLLPFVNFAQSDSVVFKTNHINVTLSNLFNRTTVLYSAGNEKPNFRISQQPLLSVGYTFNFKPQFGATLEGGIGIQTVRFSYLNVPAKTYETPVASLSLVGEARTFKFSETPLTFLAGAGFTYYGGEHFSSTAITDFINPDESVSQVFSTVKGQYARVLPFLTFGMKASKILKNKDLLFVSARYNGSLRETFSGSYALNNNADQGTFNSSRRSIQLGLGYTFTGAKKQSQIVEVIELSGKNHLEARKEVKKEKRYFDPNSYFVELAGGRILAQTKEVGSSDFFENCNTELLSTQLSVEKGIGTYYYLKAGVSYSKYSMKVRVNGKNVSGVSEMFTATGLSLGLGKRLMLNNNYNLLNIDAGVGLNAHLQDKGFKSNSFGYALSNSMDTLYKFESEKYINHSVFPTLFVGASKDFQLGRAFYLSLSYRFNLGVTQAASMNITYSDSDHTSVPTKLVLSGTSQMIHFGMKYRI